MTKRAAPEKIMLVLGLAIATVPVVGILSVLFP